MAKRNQPILFQLLACGAIVAIWLALQALNFTDPTAMCFYGFTIVWVGVFQKRAYSEEMHLIIPNFLILTGIVICVASGFLGFTDFAQALMSYINQPSGGG